MIFNKLKKVFILVFLLFSGIGFSDLFATIPDTLRLLVIGNSFSQNATRFLPEFAKERGHVLIIGRAEIGGCPLKKHWELVELAEKNPSDLKAKPYNGKSLRMLLSEGKWDVVTMQQYSMNSGYEESYMPYAERLYQFIKALQPNARIVLHQTWAYRSDSKDFTRISEKDFAKSQKEMWDKSRTAYHKIATRLNVGIIPVGDAFWKAGSAKKWAYKKDSNFDYANPVYPILPDQTNSLNKGYFWDNNNKLVFDAHHANDAGCYLAGLVWYSFLFNESVTKIKFAPPGIPSGFAVYLRETAKSVQGKMIN